MPAIDPQQGDLDAVIALLAQDANVALTAAAARLKPLNAQDMMALERMARLRLERHIAGLRLALAAAEARVAEERARWQGIDLPAALRASVQKERGAGKAKAAS